MRPGAWVPDSRDATMMQQSCKGSNAVVATEPHNPAAAAQGGLHHRPPCAARMGRTCSLQDAVVNLSVARQRRSALRGGQYNYSRLKQDEPKTQPLRVPGQHMRQRPPVASSPLPQRNHPHPCKANRGSVSGAACAATYAVRGTCRTDHSGVQPGASRTLQQTKEPVLCHHDLTTN